MSSKRKKPQAAAPVERICQASKAHLSEFYEGYVLLAITAGDRVPVLVVDKGDSTTQLALQAHVANYMMGHYGGES